MNATEDDVGTLVPLDDKVTQILVDNHRRFRSFLTQRVGDAADADEILQQSLNKALEQPPDRSNKESVLSWFFTVLRNALTDHYRSKDSEAKRAEKLKRESAVQNEMDRVRTEVCQCLKGLLPTLKDEYAEVLNRVDLEEESPETVAAELGISRNNLDVRLHRARKALKKSLILSCGTCTEHGCLDCTCG